MPEVSASYRTEPDAEFADRLEWLLEWLLAQRRGAPTSSSASEIMRATSVIGADTLPITRRHDQDGRGARCRPGRRLLDALRWRTHGRPPTSTDRHRPW